MRIQETSALPRMARRRSEADRRTLPDRRLSPSRTRLRVGLWYQYHRITRGGEFDPFPRDQYKRSRLEEALLPEILKYEFCERVEGGPVSSPRALSEAVEHLWSNPAVGCNAAGESVAVYAINEIADYLDRRYEITALDRRKADRRAAQA